MTLDDIFEECSILEYISEYVDLEQKGDGEWWGLSPFKDEKTPSFSVNDEEHIFFDYSSGKGGNILNFIMAYHKCKFPRAIEILKNYFSIENDIHYETSESLKIMKKFKPKEKRVKAVERKILPSNCMNKYKKSDIKLWEEEGILPEVMEKHLVRLDTLNDAIVFPVYDNDGNIINIKGRNIGENWETLGLTKYFHMFKLGTPEFFWGMNKEAVLKKGEIILVESEKSVMKLEGWGYDNSGAIGTSLVNDRQIETLVGLGVKVVYALDKDKGNPYQNEDVMILKKFCNVYVVLDRENLLGKKDAPVDKGKDVWEKLYSERFIL